MIRLTLLTLAATFAILMIWGDASPDARLGKPQAAAPTPPTATAPADEVAEPAAELIPVATQTPERVQEFPGPELQPSPEYGGQDTPDTAAPAIAAADGGEILYVTGNRVNFRAGPSTGDAVVGALGRGSAVEAVGPAAEGWVNIRDAQGRIGFMSAQFLSNQQPN